jgi:hypothetical protein
MGGAPGRRGLSVRDGMPRGTLASTAFQLTSGTIAIRRLEQNKNMAL